MIKEFKSLPMRESGIVYDYVLEQIEDCYVENPQLAGELAISAIELILTGEVSTSDPSIKIMLKPLEKKRNMDESNWNKKVAQQKDKKIVEQKLDQIAELYNQGMKQRDISVRLGISQQMISYRLNVIKALYPEMLKGVEAPAPVEPKVAPVVEKKVPTLDKKISQAGKPRFDF